MSSSAGRGRRKVTDPRPVPTPSVWGLLLAVIVPALYVLWVRVAIPVSRRSDDMTSSERASLEVLGAVIQPAAAIAVALGVIGVLIVRRDPHLFRWQWVGYGAIALGLIEITIYAGGWLGWWPRI